MNIRVNFANIVKSLTMILVSTKILKYNEKKKFEERNKASNQNRSIDEVRWGLTYMHI